jgi:hypothetical protein
MTAQPKKNILLNNVSEDLPKEKKIIPTRPNIDHLIKRILVERRQEKKRIFLACTFILSLMFCVLTAFYLYT